MTYPPLAFDFADVLHYHPAVAGEPPCPEEPSLHADLWQGRDGAWRWSAVHRWHRYALDGRPEAQEDRTAGTPAPTRVRAESACLAVLRAALCIDPTCWRVVAMPGAAWCLGHGSLLI